MAAALIAFALSSLLALGGVQAEDPQREFRFEGRAVIDGEPAAKGTPVQIRVADAVIASSQVQDDEGRWSLNVNAELLAKGVCDATFYVGGRRAERQWNRCTVNIVLEVGNPIEPFVPPGGGNPPDDDDPPTDPPGEGDPPTDPPGDDDPPTDPPGDGDPPTDPPGEGDPPTDPPGDDDPPTDPPGDGDPPTDPPGDGDPPTDPPGDGDPPTDPPGDGDPPTDGTPPGDTPPGETEGQDGEDDASATNRQPTGERPQTPPRTGTGGLQAESQGSRIWLLGLGAALGTAFGLALLLAARRFNDRRRGSA